MKLVKVRLQIEGKSGRFKGPWDCLTHTVKSEGFLGLYKGMASPLIGVSGVNAILFAAYGQFKKLLGSERQELSISKIAIAGSGAGINCFKSKGFDLFFKKSRIFLNVSPTFIFFFSSFLSSTFILYRDI